MWTLFDAVSLLIYGYGDKWFWYFSKFLAVVSLVIVLLFGFGAIQFGSRDNYYNSEGQVFAGGFDEFMKTLPLATWWYVGVECLTMMADHVKTPRSTIPIGQVSCVLTLFATCVLVYTSSPAPFPQGSQTFPPI